MTTCEAYGLLDGLMNDALSEPCIKAFSNPTLKLFWEWSSEANTQACLLLLGLSGPI